MRLYSPFVKFSKGTLLVAAAVLALSAPVKALAATACEKADDMWKNKVVPSTYKKLPELTSPGLEDLLTFLNETFVAKSITTVSDELPKDRLKLVHSWGTLARVKWVSTGKGPYTGIFASGAPCGIARFSLAQAPTKDGSAPGLALKFFIDGDHPSSNIQVMYSIDGQTGYNFFQEKFSNIIPGATSKATKLIADLFRQGAAFARTGRLLTIPNNKLDAANELKVTPLADTKLDGTAIKDFKEPFQLVFRPTEEAKGFMKDSKLEDDFRNGIGKIKSGTKLYEVYAYEKPDSEEGDYVADLVTTSDVVAAEYGDKTLFFKHTK